MKRIFIILICVLGLISIDAANERRSAINLSKRDIKYRPLSLVEHLNAQAYYEDGVIYVQFEYPEGDATFTVTDVVTGDNASTMFNTAMEFNYFIGSETSTYFLEISTSEGNNYEGYLTID